jgi:hypothetical protein
METNESSFDNTRGSEARLLALMAAGELDVFRLRGRQLEVQP